MAISKNKEDKNAKRCFLCKHAILMQWFENPIVAECKIRNERYVAMSDRQCSLFEASNEATPKITHFDHYEDEDNF